MNITQINSMQEVDANCWNSLVQENDPFVRHEFLLALELSGSVTADKGWQAQHLIFFEQQQIIAAMPMYLKHHSFGEYVFDQQWADAFSQSGMSYYPKWLCAIPFTPCQGQRILIKQGCDNQKVIQYCIDYLNELSNLNNVSSLHILFPNREQTDILQQQLLIRESVQFQWFNNRYRDFTDYLQSLTSRQRKKIKKERRKLVQQGIRFQRLSGLQITEKQWQIFFRFYEMTYLKRGQTAYLNIHFFKLLATTMPEQILLVLAIKGSSYIGAALSFIGQNTLYGRYWGCYEEYNGLHFETCYYQGIEYCIDHLLLRFDSGAQGEHKISRGFKPITTYSAHWIQNPHFSKLIDHFLNREKKLIDQYKQHCFNQLPFNQKKS